MGTLLWHFDKAAGDSYDDAMRDPGEMRDGDPPAPREGSMAKTRGLCFRVVLGILGVMMVCSAQGSDTAGPVEFDVGDGAVVITWGDQPRLRYRYGDVPYKPYVDALFTPEGVNPLLDAPHDHLHHHALMFAIKVDDVNFWEERDAPGTQRHTGFAEFRSVGFNRFSRHIIEETLVWQGPDATPLLDEMRTLRLYRSAELEHTLLTWEASFTPAGNTPAATLTGGHYHGLGARFVNSMVPDGVFMNAADAEGEVVRGSEKLTRAAWCAYQARAEGAPVTWAMFDHPDNARHPAWWFTMQDPFSYMSATLNLHREPFMLTRERPLVLRYGVALWDGHVSKETIEAAYQRWLALEKIGGGHSDGEE
jgi:hypothetical protein